MRRDRRVSARRTAAPTIDQPRGQGEGKPSNPTWPSSPDDEASAPPTNTGPTDEELTGPGCGRLTTGAVGGTWDQPVHPHLAKPQSHERVRQSHQGIIRM